MVQAAVARNLRRVSIESLDSFLYYWPRAPEFFDAVKNMTTDDSIRGIPCPLDLKRNENIFIIDAKSIAELSRDLGLGAFHRSPF